MGWPSVFRTVLLVGSAPDAVRARDIEPRHLSAVVAVNNAWQVREDWTYCVHAGDFPETRRPVPSQDQILVSHLDYVPANNRFGGIVYAGATMAFSAAYWVLHALKPAVIAFCGCDMIYDRSGTTHFYGNGTADPLRDDPTLQSLEAKASRLLLLAARQGCLCVNLSEGAESRLTFPRLDPILLGAPLDALHGAMLREVRSTCDVPAMVSALARESSAANFVAGGDYWNHPHLVDAAVLGEIDALWRSAHRLSPAPSGTNGSSEAIAADAGLGKVRR